MLSLARGIDRRTYLGAGLSLFAMKVMLDWALSRLLSHPYSLLFYVSPVASPLLHPDGQMTYWIAMWALALPFIAVGLYLTIRRLVDAGLSPVWAVLFFVPFANLLFFLICLVLPTREEPELAQSWAGRNRSFTRGVWTAGSLASVLGLGALALSVVVFREYGAALMVGSPVIVGFMSAIVFGRLAGPSLGGALLSSMVAFVIIGVVLIAFALEGIVCLIMAFPLVLAGALLGAVLGFATSRLHRAAHLIAGVGALLLPSFILLEGLHHLPRPVPAPVATSVTISAAPDEVWRNVLAFPPLPPATELLFRVGIASPTGARILGEGPGAVRRCEFTTGEFVEPIDIWKPGRELAFSVASQPDPMREWTLWHGLRPPHLDGYLQSTRGQFLLEELPGGRTRLTGRTWYRTNMFPEPYWRWWADSIVHRIHLRVLNHVRALSEGPSPGEPEPRIARFRSEQGRN